MHCDDLGIWLHLMNSIGKLATESVGAQRAHVLMRVVEARLAQVTLLTRMARLLTADVAVTGIGEEQRTCVCARCESE